MWWLLWEAKGCPVTPCLSPAHKSNLSLWHFPSPKHLFGQTNSVLPPSLNSSDQVLPWGYKGEQVRHLLKLKCWSRHCLAVILPALIPASQNNSEHFCVYTESQSAVVAEGHHVSAIAFRVQLQNQLVLGCWSHNSSNGQSGLILTHSPCTFNKLHVSYYLPAADNSFLPHLSERPLQYLQCQIPAKMQARTKQLGSKYFSHGNCLVRIVKQSAFPTGSQNAGFFFISEDARYLGRLKRWWAV